MYRKILIANRGEIACRIARTARTLGAQVATVHSDADADALHVREIGESVRVGPAPARASYLDIDAVVRAAQRVGADAVHPGFGFLSENAAFARACADAGIAFIGPAPETLALFGDKAAAKRLARELGIPVAAGLDLPSDDVEALLAALRDLPRPLILKAVAGGGGKGMRVVRDGDDARGAIEAAIREGRSAFGDGRLIAEHYLDAPRHVEVQILGDGEGGVIHLHDRECSLQRRYQKVVEEAPVTSLPSAAREALCQHALALGRASRYLGLGTVEFAVTTEGAVFLEVNPRLQVEHPVTEAVTGLDLVALQIRTVAERRLPLAQDEVPAPRGVAVQARLYAEDADHGFLPATGRIAAFEVPAGVRVDTGVAAGCEITPHYDPMIAKLIAHAGDREAALAALRAALADTAVLGVTTNRAFLLRLLAATPVRANEISTEFIDAWLATAARAAPDAEAVAALAAVWLAAQRVPTPDAGAWGDPALTGWRLRRSGEAQHPPATHLASVGGRDFAVGFGPVNEQGQQLVQVDDAAFVVTPSFPRRRESSEAQGADTAWIPACAGMKGQLTVNGRTLRPWITCAVSETWAAFDTHDVALTLRPLPSRAGAAVGAHQGVVRASMMGVMVAVQVAEGEVVDAGARLGTMESMKMEMALTAPVAGRVAWVGCAAQAKVERHQDLFRIEPAG
ncbi:biotin carboxylase N-terminal domain-containing protein [Ramlibacter sp.]|uniref:acetyl/propionyl/methylcrotonyl-CoA carboxylase subunit alpha n=1 Tax=Ramlibacter sp. TaxID=1917967 RepID=UPI0035B26AFE